MQVYCFFRGNCFAVGGNRGPKNTYWSRSWIPERAWSVSLIKFGHPEVEQYSNDHLLQRRCPRYHIESVGGEHDINVSKLHCKSPNRTAISLECGCMQCQRLLGLYQSIVFSDTSPSDTNLFGHRHKSRNRNNNGFWYQLWLNLHHIG